jgi:hypothetical protein
MHGILQLHEQIHNGELMKRRHASPTGGAAIEVVQRDGVPFSDPHGAADAPAPEPQSA